MPVSYRIVQRVLFTIRVGVGNNYEYVTLFLDHIIESMLNDQRENIFHVFATMKAIP